MNATAYGEDIAYIHDIGFSRFANSAAPKLLAILRAHKIFAGRIVDLGCGTGTLARHLIDADYDVVGIDISAAMLRIARAKVPEAQFQRASLLRVAIPRCSAVISIGESMNYLLDPRNSSRRRTQLFQRIYASLNRGGIFLFDVAICNMPFQPRKDFSQGKDWLIAVEVTRQGDELKRKMVSVRRINSAFRIHRETHRQLLFDSDQIQTGLKNAGFKAKQLTGYGNFRFDKFHLGFLARKD